jgi:hypothetical protein
MEINGNHQIKPQFPTNWHIDFCRRAICDLCGAALDTWNHHCRDEFLQFLL